MTCEMAVSTARPTTPPPSSQLLMTPPSTGNLNKRVRFANIPEISSRPKPHSKPFLGTQESEPPPLFCEDLQEDSDIELSDSSQAETVFSTDMALLPSPFFKTSTTAKYSVLEKHDPFASLAMAINSPVTTPESFAFLKLPLSIRQKVYSHLLVIPALVCVRQKHTSFHDEKKAFLFAERRELLPGIAYALAQLAVDGYKTRFSRFHGVNLAILRVNKEIHAESKAIMYGKNVFGIIKPTTEMSPPPDYSVDLFPPGYQYLVAKLNIRIRSFYNLHWLLGGGYNQIKHFYRGLDTLTLILEVESAGKGFGKEWARKNHEEWAIYVERLRGELVKDISGGAAANKAKMVPKWINLRVLFSGDRYVEEMKVLPQMNRDDMVASDEQARRAELKHALVEAWGRLNKSDCQ